MPGLRRIGLSIDPMRALLAGDEAGLRQRLLGRLDRHIQELGLQIRAEATAVVRSHIDGSS